MRYSLPLLLILAACSENNIGGSTDPVAGVDTGEDTSVDGNEQTYPDTGQGNYTRPEEPVDTDTGFEDTSSPTPREETDTVDSTTQPAEFAVDVLFVVDNSCSMQDEQNSLTSNFPTFIDAFLGMDGLNYHVGVVSTDMDDNNHSGRLREANGVRWLEQNTPDPYGTFNSMALLGTNGSGDEKGNLAMYAALTEPLLSGYNAGFLRPEAALAVVIISDENDDSNIDNPGISPSEAITFLQGIKPDPAMVSYSTIVGELPNGCATTDEPGIGYHEVRDAIGGINASICSANWAQVLDDLAENAASLRREFFLDDLPVPSSIQVWVIEQDGTRVDLVNGQDFTYNAQRNSVQLTNYTPPPYAEIFVAYDKLFGTN
ncbi:MAG: hypothetical protein EP330_19840 [Deltaproteobacteria bacterium]|nr:MAG: hypothetical protein EP330_19840 [Deltaproteobacteria bacterium]